MRITAPDAAGLTALIAAAGWSDLVEPADPAQPGVAVIHEVSAAQVGARAFGAGLELHELAPSDIGLEGVFLRLVGDDPGPAANPTSTSARDGGVR